MSRCPSTQSSDTPGLCEARIVWGEGFANDSLADFARSVRWDACSDDELVFHFPSLRATDAAGAARLAALLRHRSADLARRVRDREGAAGPQRSWLSRLVVPRARPAVPGEAAVGLSLLDDVLAHVLSGRGFAFSDDRAALFAFTSGIHPAYVSAGTLPGRERDIAAGWLGHLDRGRTALIPSVVAEYLFDVTERRDGRVAVRDAGLAQMVPLPADWLRIRRAAERRLDGEDCAIRLHAPGWRSRLPQSRPPRLPVFATTADRGRVATL